MQQLQNERFIMGFPGDRCGLYAAVMSICHRAGFTPTVSQVTDEMQLTLGFIATGMGVALLPHSIRRFHRDGVVYRRVQPAAAAIELAIAWRQSHSNPTLQNFLQVVRDTARSGKNG